MNQAFDRYALGVSDIIGSAKIALGKPMLLKPCQCERCVSVKIAITITKFGIDELQGSFHVHGRVIALQHRSIAANANTGVDRTLRNIGRGDIGSFQFLNRRRQFALEFADKFRARVMLGAA